MNYKLSEINAILGTIDPQAVATTVITSDYILPEVYNKLMFVVNIGATAGAGTLTVFSSDDTNGTATTALQTQAITTNDANKQYVINYAAQNTDTDQPYVACKIVAATTNTILASAVIVGSQARYLATDTDLASVNILN